MAVVIIDSSRSKYSGICMHALGQIACVDLSVCHCKVAYLCKKNEFASSGLQEEFLLQGQCLQIQKLTYTANIRMPIFFTADVSQLEIRIDISNPLF
jgi:hypothetical protein